MASAMLEHASSAGVRDRGGERFGVQVVVDIETLAAALGLDLDRNRPVRIGARAYLPRTGAFVSDAELVRMVCEGTVQLLIDDEGQPLWLGAETRLFSRQQRRALRHRAGGGAACCEFPGCPATRFIEAHHIIKSCDGGPTDLDNGAMLCAFHHRELHRRGWRIEVRGAQLTFYDGARCLGSSGTPRRGAGADRGVGVDRRAGVDRGVGPVADMSVLPFQSRPPDPPPGIAPDSCCSGGGGEPLTRWGLDVLLQHLLEAA